jgi:hypothetical protein
MTLPRKYSRIQTSHRPSIHSIDTRLIGNYLSTSPSIGINPWTESVPRRHTENINTHLGNRLFVIFTYPWFRVRHDNLWRIRQSLGGHSKISVYRTSFRRKYCFPLWYPFLKALGIEVRLWPAWNIVAVMQKSRMLRTVFVVVRRFFFDTLDKNVDIFTNWLQSRAHTLHHFPFSSFSPSACYQEQLWWNMSISSPFRK